MSNVEEACYTPPGNGHSPRTHKKTNRLVHRGSRFNLLAPPITHQMENVAHHLRRVQIAAINLCWEYLVRLDGRFESLESRFLSKSLLLSLKPRNGPHPPSKEAAQHTWAAVPVPTPHPMMGVIELLEGWATVAGKVQGFPKHITCSVRYFWWFKGVTDKQ